MKHRHISFPEYNATATVAEDCPQKVIDALREMCRIAYYNLNDESKQPQPPDLANTVLGEVPPVVNDGIEEHGRAVEGATPAVRQNEQTKEVCQCVLPIRDTTNPDLCAYCLHEFVG